MTNLLNVHVVVFLGKNFNILNLFTQIRPEMTGLDHEAEKPFWKIIDDWRCCDPSLMVYGEDTKRLKYKISGECCQAGIVCKSMKMCYEVKFCIFDANCKDEDPKNAVGSITRKIPNLAEALFTDADCFEVNLPENATVNEKLMIIGAVLMLDYTYFEDDSASEQK